MRFWTFCLHSRSSTKRFRFLTSSQKIQRKRLRGNLQCRGFCLNSYATTHCMVIFRTCTYTTKSCRAMSEFRCAFHYFIKELLNISGPRTLGSDRSFGFALDSGPVKYATGWNGTVVLRFIGEDKLLVCIVESSGNLCSYTVLPPSLKGTYCCGQVVLEGGRMPWKYAWI